LSGGVEDEDKDVNGLTFLLCLLFGFAGLHSPVGFRTMVTTNRIIVIDALANYQVCLFVKKVKYMGRQVHC
jgi:hypothetical protein